MGALAPLTVWVPGDDLLLKNAVEAGASLESLAKGAVSFSRRFTLRELQDRWYSLLYDPETSEEASARMIEHELELASTNPSKGNRNCNLKGKYSASGKRRGDSIRSHYYSRQKHARNDLCNAENPGFFVAQYPAVATDTIYSCGDQLNQYQANNICPGESTLNCYEYPKAGYDNGHSIFPEMLGPSSAVSSEQSFENDYIQKDPQFLEENLASLDASKDIHENSMNQPLPVSHPSHSKVKEVEPLPCSASEIDNYDFVHKNHKSSINIMEFEDPVHHLDYSSSKICLPCSEMITDISSQTILMNMHIGDGEVLPIGDNINEPELNSLSADVNVGDGVSDIGISEPAMISESDLMDFSGDFMEFADDEDLMFMNIDDNDIGDASCLNGLSSILLNSPIHEENHANLSDIKNTNTDNLDISVDILEEAYSEGTDKDCDLIWSIDDELTDCVSEENLPTYSRVSRASVPLERLPNCVLSTEDREIPCNDEVLLTLQLLPQFSATTKLLPAAGKPPLVESNKVKEEQMPIPNTAASPFTTMPSAMPKVGLLNPNNDRRLEPKSFERGFTAGVSRDAGLSVKEKKSCMLQSSAGTLQKEELEFDTSVNPSLEITAPGPDHAKHQTSNIADGCKSKLDMQAISTSDQELQMSESEDDVPNFSDVEALILDMDLGPYDQESCLFTKEVSLYQPVHSKKAIMRLEQGAHAYMNRKIASHGAFAVFYGRLIKYYVKKPEVLLGRRTDDVEVDIDLREEGPANRISRRQAIIKMDKDGSFLLKNIGKCSIFVNSKEVAARKRIVLISGSLIEIRNLKFIFDVNRSAVRSYIATVRPARKGQITEFDWLHGQNE
ncbi:hypothetical protein Cni_G08085 [Canna indica]|uniref:FHA domain-containing protein n=1 Tax=Canna indica TaxID=4628 RepID=A0AAQ3K1I4_9LILI|nr:hypothetical protein Cni_G08085 [Canna indica]